MKLTARTTPDKIQLCLFVKFLHCLEANSFLNSNKKGKSYKAQIFKSHLSKILENHPSEIRF